MLDLKVLDAGLSDATVKVEDIGLRVIVPHRSFVVQLKDALLTKEENKWLKIKIVFRTVKEVQFNVLFW